MKKEEFERLKSAAEAYEARRAEMQRRYQAIRCGHCGREILPGDDLWAPWSHTDRAYCSAECAAMALGVQCLEMDDDDYTYFFTEKTEVDI